MSTTTPSSPGGAGVPPTTPDRSTRNGTPAAGGRTSLRAGGKQPKAPKAPKAQGAMAGSGIGAPSSTRRRPAMIGLAVLLIVGCAAIAGLLAVRLDSRSPALVASRAIPIGQQITAADLSEERVSGDGLTVLGADQKGRVVGSYAAQDIPQGRLIDADMLQNQGWLKQGSVAVGVSVTAGRMPASGLQSGDRVQVVQVVEGTPTVLVDEAVVSSGPSADSSSSGGGLLGGSGGGGSSSGGGVATLIVSPDAAPKVAAASAANRIAIILISRGQSLGGQ